MDDETPLRLATAAGTVGHFAVPAALYLAGMALALVDCRRRWLAVLVAVGAWLCVLSGLMGMMILVFVLGLRR